MSMGDVSVVLFLSWAFIWAAILLPFSVSYYLLLSASAMRAAGALKKRLHYQIALAAPYCISFALLFPIIAYTGRLQSLLICVLCAMILGTAVLLWAYGRILYPIYGIFPGINASTALALSVLDGIRNENLPNGAVILLLLGMSLLFTLLVIGCLKRKILPFSDLLGSGWKWIFDFSALVFLALLFLCHYDGVGLHQEWPKYIIYSLCLIGTGASYFRNAWFLTTVMDWASYKERSKILENSLQLQQAQFSALSIQIHDIRAFRHDMRQHLRVMEQYIRDGNREALREYLTNYQDQLAETLEGKSICAHPALDALARYYLPLIKETGARIDVALDMQSDINIAAADLCIIFGNCMENALEAIQKTEPEKRFLRLRANQVEQTLTFAFGNSYSEICRGEDGEFLSTKHKGGPGVGLSSIRKAAQKYGGSVKIEAENGEFRIYIILFETDAAAAVPAPQAEDTGAPRNMDSFTEGYMHT